MKNTKISAGTIIRTLVLLLALTNQILAAFGKSPLPISSEELTQCISALFTVVAALLAWWENNSFTAAAITADGVRKELCAMGDVHTHITDNVTDIKG